MLLKVHGCPNIDEKSEMGAQVHNMLIIVGKSITIQSLYFLVDVVRK